MQVKMISLVTEVNSEKIVNSTYKFPKKRSFIIFSRTDMVSIADSAITEEKFTMLPEISLISELILMICLLI